MTIQKKSLISSRNVAKKALIAGKPAFDAPKTPLASPASLKAASYKSSFSPKVAGAKVAAAKVASAKIATPKVAGAKIATPKVAGAKIATPKVAGAKIASPKVATAKAASPKAAY